MLAGVVRSHAATLDEWADHWEREAQVATDPMSVEGYASIAYDLRRVAAQIRRSTEPGFNKPLPPKPVMAETRAEPRDG